MDEIEEINKFFRDKKFYENDFRTIQSVRSSLRRSN